MPARKPVDLHTRHATKAEKAARVASEDAMTPARGLPMAAPARLAKHEQAATIWRRLVRLYSELESEIVTALDQDLLIDYCILMEQIGELDMMRKSAFQAWLELGLAHDQAKKQAREAAASAKEAQRFANETGALMPEKGPGSLAEVDKLEGKILDLAIACTNAFDAVVKLDARGDQKRKTLLQWRQSLYLTPRARAGTAPTKREEEPEQDPMDALLGEVTEYVNKDRDHE